MNDPINLSDYRCSCGRLLFKGKLLECHLEIKCKRCGKISSFEGSFSYDDLSSFIIEVDDFGMIHSACPNAEKLLDYKKNDLLGKSIESICPLLRDRVTQENLSECFDEGRPYEIKENIFFTRDGKTISPISCCVKNQYDGAPGFRMFNCLGNGKNQNREL